MLEEAVGLLELMGDMWGVHWTRLTLGRVQIRDGALGGGQQPTRAFEVTTLERLPMTIATPVAWGMPGPASIAACASASASGRAPSRHQARARYASGNVGPEQGALGAGFGERPFPWRPSRAGDGPRGRASTGG